MKLKLEVEDNLNELVQDCINEVQDWFYRKIKELKNIEKVDHQTIESLIDTLNYNGSLHSIIDTNVPIYTHELDTLYYLHKYKLEEAFEDCGIGDKSDYENSENAPLGFEGVAIFCYLELKVNEWLTSTGWFNNEFRPKNDDGTFQDIGFQEWFSSKYWSVE